MNFDQSWNNYFCCHFYILGMKIGRKKHTHVNQDKIAIATQMRKSSISPYTFFSVFQPVLCVIYIIYKGSTWLIWYSYGSFHIICNFHMQNSKFAGKPNLFGRNFKRSWVFAEPVELLFPKSTQPLSLWPFWGIKLFSGTVPWRLKTTIPQGAVFSPPIWSGSE